MQFYVDTSNVLKTSLETLIVNCLTFLQAISVVLLSDSYSGICPPDRRHAIAMKDVSAHLPRLHLWLFLTWPSRSCIPLSEFPLNEGLSLAFTTTQKHSPAYPLYITSQSNISRFSSFGLPVWVCLMIYVCVSAHMFLAILFASCWVKLPWNRTRCL